MNIPTCPLCTSDRAKLAFIKFNYSHYHCCSCKSLYVYPSPLSKELEEFYRSNEIDQMSKVCWTDVPDSHKYIWDVWKQVLEFAEIYSGSGPLLDLGCGTGQFLAFAKKIGWSDLTGIEWNTEAANIAKQRSGAVIYSSDILNTCLPPQSFSCITLWDVIEHLNDVKSLLKETFHLLKPGGTIIIGTPYRYGLSIRLLKEHALTVNPPEHLIFFTHIGMRQALHSAGFNVLKQWSFSIQLREWVNFFSQLSRNRAVDDKRYVGCRSSILQSELFLIMMRIANTLLRSTNLGDQLIAIGQKPNLP